MALKDKKPLRRGLIFVIPLVTLTILAVIFVGQENKLAEIKTEQTAYEEKLLALQNEGERLERMIEYAKTEEYMLQYAREMLGFVMPEDIRFDLEDE